MLAESFVLLDSLIFKLVTITNKEAVVLAITEVCIDKIIRIESCKFIHRLSGSSEDIPHNERQILYSKSNALFKIFHKRMSCLSTIKIQ